MQEDRFYERGKHFQSVISSKMCPPMKSLIQRLVRLTLFFGIVFAGPLEAASRPNIVFAFADDWGRYASAYAKLEPGGPSDLVATPNFDRIAKEGVLFKNAFVNAPSCTPCRSSLLSGQYFWRTGRGAILQGAIWDETIPTYPLLLEKEGYHIGHSYKVWSPGTVANAPYGARRTAYNKSGNKFNRFSQFASAAENPEAAKQTLYDEVRGNFTSFLKDRDKNEPFCYWFGPTNCHRKWIKGSGKALWGIDPDELEGKLPPYLPDVHIVREDFADYLGEVQAFDNGLGVLIDELERLGELENTIVIVSGDHGVPGIPRGKCNLYDLGTHVPLAIRWGKNVPAGRIVEDFVCLPDLAPTFLEAAGIEPPTVMTGRSLLNVLEAGSSGLVDASRDAVITGRERHVASVREGNLPYPQRAIRTKDFLYIHNFKPERYPMGDGNGFGKPVEPLPTYDELANNTFAAYGDLDASPTKAYITLGLGKPEMQEYLDIAFGLRPKEELYDIKKDPHQLNNLAGNADYSKVREQLSTRLFSVLRETGDPRVTGDGTTYDTPPFTDAFKRRKR
ncbi:Choline-sulfatase [Thalassoglobus polymorphus]|uniref:Choline-sulfatase n=2 Tax=Thalassoglobus polymorphus TaxID=2527994 RepID=A0A517QV32_9PLAN|nr:Choline-sulfatase [Thalassoglobus polymorphus]